MINYIVIEKYKLVRMSTYLHGCVVSYA
jgi:hypothetical protein